MSKRTEVKKSTTNKSKFGMNLEEFDFKGNNSNKSDSDSEDFDIYSENPYKVKGK